MLDAKTAGLGLSAKSDDFVEEAAAAVEWAELSFAGFSCEVNADD